MTVVLGCIADDLTGATDLAMILVREGMKTVQVVGVPDATTPIPDADCVVVALKSRTVEAKDAVAMSLAACKWLQNLGAKQIFFKYCSTFDSTKDGNIGPVTDALMKHLNCASTIACPAFPENARTLYRGYLFVNDGLLSESSLRNHPLTPMGDANLRRVLAAQSSSHISNVYYEDVDRGPLAVAEAFKDHFKAPRTIHIVDALNDDHLRTIGLACDGMALVTGGSAVAQGLPANFRKAGLLREKNTDFSFSAPAGASVILAGSCSEATLAQVAYAKKHVEHFRLDAEEILAGKPIVETALSWAQQSLKQGKTIMFYSSAAPDQVKNIQHQNDRIAVGAKIETVIGKIASALKTRGVRRFVVAGGETSGAVIAALGVPFMEIGPQIDPGVPWTKSLEGEALALALKSGNFGSEDFFIKALERLESIEKDQL